MRQNRTPRASIVVVNWNGERVLRACLASLLNQSYGNFEVIVVDNASEDSSRDIIREEFPQVRLIANEQNYGFAKGNNIGITAARGELVALFNNDATADRNWLHELVHGLLASPEAAIAMGPIYYQTGDQQIWSAGGRLDLVTGLAWHLDRLEQRYINRESDYFPLCAALIRREVFENIGLLDERFFLYSEDIDFSLRVRGAGLGLKFVPGATVRHEAPARIREESLFTLRKKLESEFKLILKTWPMSYLPFTLFLRLLPISLAYIVILRYPHHVFRLHWQAFLEASRVREKEDVQRASVITPKVRVIEALEEVKRLLFLGGL